MDINEPVKTACGQTLREATAPITLHISADADLPINVEVVNDNGTVKPIIDSAGFTRLLTKEINAFVNTINA